MIAARVFWCPECRGSGWAEFLEPGQIARSFVVADAVARVVCKQSGEFGRFMEEALNLELRVKVCAVLRAEKEDSYRQIYDEQDEENKGEDASKEEDKRKEGASKYRNGYTDRGVWSRAISTHVYWATCVDQSAQSNASSKRRKDLYASTSRLLDKAIGLATITGSDTGSSNTGEDLKILSMASDRLVSKVLEGNEEVDHIVATDSDGFFRLDNHHIQALQTYNSLGSSSHCVNKVCAYMTHKIENLDQFEGPVLLKSFAPVVVDFLLNLQPKDVPAEDHRASPFYQKYLRGLYTSIHNRAVSWDGYFSKQDKPDEDSESNENTTESMEVDATELNQISQPSLITNSISLPEGDSLNSNSSTNSNSSSSKPQKAARRSISASEPLFLVGLEDEPETPAKGKQKNKPVTKTQAKIAKKTKARDVLRNLRPLKGWSCV